jgi:twitching motility two-component system response regulator PilG
MSEILQSVLLVQTTRRARQGTAALLKGAVERIREAEDGFDALCQLARERPQLVVMDYHLPRLGGFQTCALLRNSTLFRGIRIILLGDSDNLVDRTRAELAGADGYLVKPYRREELLGLLEASP